VLEPNWYVLVRTWGPMVYTAAWRVLGNAADAEDVVQDVFTEALRHWKSSKVRNWAGWLRRVAVCRAIDKLRQRRSYSTLDSVSEPIHSQTADAVLENRELREQLRESLQQLSEHEAAIFCLRYFEELSYDEIAKTLDMETAAVGMALHRARTKLAQLMEPLWKEV
jgi:RNA polymerase sigma-70 factor (ECF subfamily)